MAASMTADAALTRHGPGKGLRIGILMGSFGVSLLLVWWLAPVAGPFASALPTFLGVCEALREAGIGPLESDWWCIITPGSIHRASFLQGAVGMAGYVVSGLVLTRVGWRWAALLPAALAFLVGSDAFTASEVGVALSPLWFSLALLAIPAVPVVVSFRLFPVPRRGAIGVRLVPALVALGLLGLGYGLLYPLVQRVPFGSEASPWIDSAPMIAMVTFGLLLGAARRWWPWVLILTAILLSQGIVGLLPQLNPEYPVTTLLFGGALTLFVAGLFASLLQPLVRRISRVIPGGPSAVPVGASRDGFASSSTWWSRVGNGVAIGALALAMWLPTVDSLGVYVSMPLPTYEGARERLEERGALVQLTTAMRSADAYYDRTGSYRWFDQKIGSAGEPRLEWQTLVSGGDVAPALTEGGVAIAGARGDTVRLIARWGHGPMVCLQRDRAGRTPKTTWGSLEWSPSLSLASAQAACEDRPLVSQDLVLPPIVECDAELPNEICRRQQALMTIDHRAIERLRSD